MAVPRSNTNSQTASSSCPWARLCPSRVGFPPVEPRGTFPGTSVSHTPGPAASPEPLTRQLPGSGLAQHLQPAQIPPGGGDRGCFISVPTPGGPHTHQEDEAVQEQGVEESHGPSSFVGQDEPPLQRSRTENPILMWVTGKQLSSNGLGEVLARAGSLFLPDSAQTCREVVFGTHQCSPLSSDAPSEWLHKCLHSQPKLAQIEVDSGLPSVGFPPLKTLLGVYLSCFSPALSCSCCASPASVKARQ